MLKEILTNEYVINAIGIVLTIIVSAVLNQVRKNIKNKDITNAIIILEDTVNKTVKAAQQKYTEKYKEANEDGKLTSEEQTQIRNFVINSVIQNLSVGTKKLLSMVYSNLDGVIETYLESFIKDMKENK